MTDANGLAAIAILGSLVDTLIAKGVLTKEEGRKAVVGAYDRLTGRPGGIGATTIVGEIAKRLV